MRFSTLIASASLISAAVAAPANHEHNEKRDVVTTTVQAQITITVDANGNPLETVAAAEAVNAVTTTAPIAQNKVTAVADKPVAKTSAQGKASAVASASSSSAKPASTGSASSSSGVKGITYSPYNADGTCKSTSQVASDLAQLKDYPTIRLYGVDCNQVANVLKAKTASQKVFLGIYFVDQIQAGVDTMKAAIDQFGSWNDVVTVSIGNELVNGGQATPAQVGQYIATGRAALKAAGYSGPIVSVDTFIAVINNPELCQYSDYMAVNAHAYFDQNTVAENSGTWLLNQIQRVWNACDGKKDVVITESGWPSQGQTYGVAVPSKENQQKAVSAITSSCGADTYLYNAFNDYWKADGNLGVEKYFGILSN